MHLETAALALRDRKAEHHVTFFEQFGTRLAERDGYVDRLLTAVTCCSAGSERPV
jgi:hypothetical protein